MSLSTQPYKGTRDFYPDDMRTRKWMFAKWRKVVESFGYEEYDGPILEPLELYTAKTSEEIVNDQSFNFEDRGGRRVVMRPEMTPTVSRMVAGRRQELGYPLRLYSIPNCFRYERQQRGRLREFWQLNVDLFGLEGIEADVENIQIADALLKEFGANENQYEIRVNSRKYMNSIYDELELSDEEKKTITGLIDKKAKIDSTEFEKIFREKLGEEKATKLLKVLNNNDAIPESIGQLIGSLEKHGVKNVTFEPSIARGFEYYTDIVFEVFDKTPENNRSMFGGGRYDGLVGEFGVEPVPTVGFGMGDVTFQNFLESNKLLPEQTSETDVYIIVIGDVLTEAQKVAQALREKGVNVAVDISGRKTDKQITNANKKNISYKVFVGSEEVSSQLYSVDGQNQKLSLDQIVSLIKSSK
ncbi:MAG: histidine--tRNA ligase [Candidatus Saccharibacteria bacterium]|nr:histidine--tRNA ligase [Candidatus Saccharibacteria bacterium]